MYTYIVVYCMPTLSSMYKFYLMFVCLLSPGGRAKVSTPTTQPPYFSSRQSTGGSTGHGESRGAWRPQWQPDMLHSPQHTCGWDRRQAQGCVTVTQLFLLPIWGFPGPHGVLIRCPGPFPCIGSSQSSIFLELVYQFGSFCVHYYIVWEWKLFFFFTHLYVFSLSWVFAQARSSSILLNGSGKGVLSSTLFLISGQKQLVLHY